MKNFGKILAATAGLLGLLAGAPAIGGPLPAPTCTSTINLGNSGSVTYAELTPGVCVQVIDKLFGGFTFGGTGTFVPNNQVTWNTLIIGGLLVHQVSFNNAYVNGFTYNLGFEVAVTDPNLAIVALGGDFTQAACLPGQPCLPSTLTKNSTPGGLPAGGINLVKVGTQATGPDTILYNPGVQDLVISETLTDQGAISSITNTIIENGIPTQVPEPASLALLGIGLSALGLSRRRKQS